MTNGDLVWFEKYEETREREDQSYRVDSYTGLHQKYDWKIIKRERVEHLRIYDK
jgi:hypothetical protein